MWWREWKNLEFGWHLNKTSANKSPLLRPVVRTLDQIRWQQWGKCYLNLLVGKCGKLLKELHCQRPLASDKLIQIFRANERYFFLTTNQSTVFSAMTYRLSEQDARWTHRTSGYPIRGARDELSFLTATFVRQQNRKKEKNRGVNCWTQSRAQLSEWCKLVSCIWHVYIQLS